MAPNNTSTMANTMASSQTPIPNINTSDQNISKRRLAHCQKNPKPPENDPAKTIHALVKLGETMLGKKGIESARLDAEILLAHALKCSRLDVIVHSDRQIDLDIRNLFFQYLARREKLEPIAYITGEKEFFGINFYVDRQCLIPRPDTECIVENCLSLIKNHRIKTLLDVGTGSGAIALSIAKNFLDLEIFASDISEKALEIAQKNYGRHQYRSPVNFIHANLLDFSEPKKTFDLIVSNPPYIAENSYLSLDKNVLNFEPELALNSKEKSGLIFYEKILHQAENKLKSQGFLVFEFGFDQKKGVTDLIDGSRWHIVRYLSDLAGRDRGVVLQLLK